MATRFGAAQQGSGRQSRGQVVFGAALVFVAVIAVGAIFWLNSIAKKSQTADVASATPGVTSLPVSSTERKILVATQRIERGMAFQDHMFRAETWEASKAPAESIPATELPVLRTKFSKEIIQPGLPILREQIADSAGVSPIDIPPGYRAMSLVFSRRELVEGFVRPGSRVDIQWTYEEAGQKNIATIVTFVKVLSVAGITGQPEGGKMNVNEATTVTVLLTPEDSRRVELARQSGTLSLVLVSDENKVPSDPKGGGPAVTTKKEILGTPDEEVQCDGNMISKDDKTGREVRYCLRGGTWHPVEE